jgi:hypothetical protein
MSDMVEKRRGKEDSSVRPAMKSSSSDEVEARSSRIDSGEVTKVLLITPTTAPRPKLHET